MRKGRRKSTRRARRNRRVAAAALDNLLSRLLGLVWERGRVIEDAATCAVVYIFGEIEVALCLVGGGVIDVSVNAFVESDWKPVFSAQLADPAPSPQYRWWGRRCAIFTWHRGQWEMVVTKQNVAKRSLADVRAFGLTRVAA